MIKAVVFDLGGTWMEYRGMPLNWEEYYFLGFQKVDRKNKLDLSEEDMLEAIKVLKAYNPRNSGREYEVIPEVIFEEATAVWKVKPKMEKLIRDFFAGMPLKPHVFDYTDRIIRECKNKGLLVACLTDLPSGMPDQMFRATITAIEPLLDLYVSSQICGYRKPNRKGIEYIADAFGIEVSEILFVGDEKKDEDTAINAGCGFKYIKDYMSGL